jgi:hypothetical protein
VQLDPEPGCLVDEVEVLSEWHQQPQLHFADVGRRIEAAIAGACEECRCRRAVQGCRQIRPLLNPTCGTAITRAPSNLAISGDPSLLPLSTITISLRKLCRAMYERALAIQIGNVRASFRQGIKMVRVISSLIVIRLAGAAGAKTLRRPDMGYNGF